MRLKFNRLIIIKLKSYNNSMADHRRDNHRENSDKQPKKQFNELRLNKYHQIIRTGGQIQGSSTYAFQIKKIKEYIDDNKLPRWKLADLESKIKVLTKKKREHRKLDFLESKYKKVKFFGKKTPWLGLIKKNGRR